MMKERIDVDIYRRFAELADNLLPFRFGRIRITGLRRQQSC